MMVPSTLRHVHLAGISFSVLEHLHRFSVRLDVFKDVFDIVGVVLLDSKQFLIGGIRGDS